MQETPKDVLLLLNRKSKHMLMDNLQEIQYFLQRLNVLSFKIFN